MMFATHPIDGPQALDTISERVISGSTESPGLLPVTPFAQLATHGINVHSSHTPLRAIFMLPLF